MRIELVRIGNSRGIRIPKPLIEQCSFGDAETCGASPSLHSAEIESIVQASRTRGWRL